MCSSASFWRLHDTATAHGNILQMYQTSSKQNIFLHIFCPNLVENHEENNLNVLNFKRFVRDFCSWPISPHQISSNHLIGVQIILWPGQVFFKKTFKKQKCFTKWLTNIFVSQLQWIQSKDDKGKLFYYLKGGSKCQWTLPEVCVWFCFICHSVFVICFVFVKSKTFYILYKCMSHPELCIYS